MKNEKHNTTSTIQYFINIKYITVQTISNINNILISIMTKPIGKTNNHTTALLAHCYEPV